MIDTGSAYVGPAYSVHHVEQPRDADVVTRIVRRARYELLREMVNEAREDGDLMGLTYVEDYAKKHGFKI